MDIMDTIQESLQNNKHLNKDVSDGIFELVVIFHNSFPNVNLENLNKRLKTLKIEKTSKFEKSHISNYSFTKNVLYFNSDEISKEYDARHVMMFELLNIITATDKQTGFNTDNRFLALNVGLTEIIANFLVGNEGEKLLYPDEAIMTNLINTVVGFENMLYAYFNNDSKSSVSMKNSKSILAYVSLFFWSSGIVLVVTNRIKYKSHKDFLLSSLKFLLILFNCLFNKLVFLFVIMERSHNILI